ncbi:MAG TPA: hypothetical protein VHV10_00990 [Ktedonobacteraceae bacterium]|nr:hypothetical protein [Ktedonobacteraceae bacterium]
MNRSWEGEGQPTTFMAYLTVLKELQTVDLRYLTMTKVVGKGWLEHSLFGTAERAGGNDGRVMALATNKASESEVRPKFITKLAGNAVSLG